MNAGDMRVGGDCDENLATTRRDGIRDSKGPSDSMKRRCRYLRAAICPD
jgi:hypothetical protein